MQRPRGFMVAGTHSGCGKTTLALALMAAFRARGIRVQPFKVGPDFIDPGFHTHVSGRESRNLDGWMLGREYSGSLFWRLLGDADLAVVEGVMGLFDGYDGVSESGSSAEMAKWLNLPVILVVDARSMARSAAALVLGFSRFDPALNLTGVIFNRIGSPGHLDYLKEAMTASLPGIAVLGGIPREDAVAIPERHLGLVTADEVLIDPAWEKRLAALVEEYVDLDGILRRAVIEGGLPPEEAALPRGSSGPAVPIAVARDAAFCFYYPDNLELLRRAGAELLFFSPLAGQTVPERAGGIYLGGGYPEVHAETLSGNRPFLDGIRRAASRGMPVYAECGGLMVLSRFVETIDAERYPMAGLLPFGTRMLKRRKSLGYTEVVLRRDCLLGPAETVIRGHEFHYSEIVGDERPGPAGAYRLRARKFHEERLEGYTSGSVLASYVHLHWGSAPQAAEAFVARCRDFLYG